MNCAFTKLLGMYFILPFVLITLVVGWHSLSPLFLFSLLCLVLWKGDCDLKKKKKRFRFGISRERNVLSCKYYDLKNLRVKKPHLKIHNTNLMSSIKNCCCSVAKLCRLFVTPWTAAHQGSLSCPSLSPSVCSNSCPLSQ